VIRLVQAITVVAALAAMGASEARMTTPYVGFTVVPPGPVTDKVRVELRLGLGNHGDKPIVARVRLHADRRDARRLVADRTVTVPPGGTEMVSAWWDARGKVGSHRMLYRVEMAGERREGAWPLEVVRCPTRALPYFQGAWLDGYGRMDPASMGKGAVERELRLAVDAMHRLGIDTLIYTFPEWYGQFYYPSKIEFYDRDIKGVSKGSSCKVDAIGTILSQAERNGQRVIVGLGRNGDLPLLWEFDKPDWKERNDAAIGVSRRVARELWALYGKRKSFYGWYLTHEMNDLGRSSAYYDPVASFCKSLAPDKPVLIAPAGTPIWDRKVIGATRVDIIAPQDAVGSGYMPYVNTWDPYKRIATLEGIYTGYSELFKDTGKHLWTDLEIWEMDGKSGYANSYPPEFARVRQQIAIERKYVDMLTAYAYFGFLQHPGSSRHSPDPRAVKLYEEYVAYLKALPAPLRPPEMRRR